MKTKSKTKLTLPQSSDREDLLCVIKKWLQVLKRTFWKTVLPKAMLEVSESGYKLSAYVHPKLLQSCLTLCDPRDCSPPGSPVHGILQPGILEWLAMPSYRGSSWHRDRTCVSPVSCTGRRVHHTTATWEACLYSLLSLQRMVSWVAALVTQSPRGLASKMGLIRLIP